MFQAFERTIVNGGTVKINEEVHSIEDLIDEAKEEELKDSNDEEKELQWDYLLLEELLPQEQFFIR